MPPPLSRPTEKPQRSPASLCTRWIAGALCLLWLTGCVPAIFNRKPGSVGGGKPEKASTLIKPRVSAGAEGDSREKDSRGKEPGKEGKQDDKPEQRATLPSEKQTRSILVKPERGTASPEAKDSAGTTPPAAKKTFGGPAFPKTVEERLASGSETGDDLGNDSGSIKKHDHLQYVQLIEEKAREMLKEHRDASLVRICKDSTTDQWTMNVYGKDAKSYSFISYTWDEVDEKWEKSFESRKQPLKRWKSHLDFSAARKTCKVLKGSLD